MNDKKNIQGFKHFDVGCKQFYNQITTFFTQLNLVLNAWQNLGFTFINLISLICNQVKNTQIKKSFERLNKKLSETAKICAEIKANDNLRFNGNYSIELRIYFY